MERSSLVQKLEENDANRPNISLVAILGLLDNLRGHIERSTTDGVVDLVELLEFLREAKVRDLDLKSTTQQVYILQELLLLSF